MLQFERVAQDSRCPVGVNCVWEGDAIARIRVEASGASPAVLELHTNAEFAREAVFQNHRIRLVRLAPPRQAESDIPPENYVATLVATAS